MARVDITDQLTFDEAPCLVIKGKEIAVNTDAPTVLKVMSCVTEGGDMSIAQINDAYKLIFPEKSRALIDEMKLGMSDWMVVVQAAISMATGGDAAKPGEQ